MTIAILGEANSGKSSLSNVICGVSALPTMPIANTRLPTVLRYADAPSIAVAGAFGQRAAQPLSPAPEPGLTHIEVGLPSETLREFEVIDYPGATLATSADLRSDFISRKPDIAVWTTTATQAWRESERSTWSMVGSGFRGRAILAVTHIDFLKNPGDIEKLVSRLKPLIERSFNEIVLTSMKAGDETGPVIVMSALRSVKADIERHRIEKARQALTRIAKRAFDRLPGSL